MAFMQHIPKRIVKCVRPLSATCVNKTGQQIQKSVFISQSNDVYTNLALEQWLHNHFDFKNHHAMLFYKNDPCIVLGRNDNPWTETNISSQPEAEDNKAIALARRPTDSTIQYHDHGAMNLTFFGDQFEQSYNLGVIARGIFRKYGLTVGQNDDGTLNFYSMKLSASGLKVETGTSGTGTPYQNCTLFVDVNKKHVENALIKGKTGNAIQNNYLNICEIEPHVTTAGLLSAIGWEYMRTAPFELKDAGEQLVQRQRGFQMINPTDEWFPGLQAIRNKLVTWQWCYGTTPKFSIFRTFQVPQAFLKNASDSNELRVKLDVENGRIADISLVVPSGLLTSGFTGEAKIITGLRGHKFSEEALGLVEQFLGLEKYHNEREKFVTECVKKAMVI